MPDPISRLQFARNEVDRVFGAGYAAAHPEVVASVMTSAAIDYAAQVIAAALVAESELDPEATMTRPAGIIRAVQMPR